MPCGSAGSALRGMFCRSIQMHARMLCSRRGCRWQSLGITPLGINQFAKLFKAPAAAQLHRTKAAGSSRCPSKPPGLQCNRFCLTPRPLPDSNTHRPTRMLVVVIHQQLPPGLGLDALAGSHVWPPRHPTTYESRQPRAAAVLGAPGLLAVWSSTRSCVPGLQLGVLRGQARLRGEAARTLQEKGGPAAAASSITSISSRGGNTSLPASSTHAHGRILSTLSCHQYQWGGTGLACHLLQPLA